MSNPAYELRLAAIRNRDRRARLMNALLYGASAVSMIGIVWLACRMMS